MMGPCTPTEFPVGKKVTLRRMGYGEGGVRHYPEKDGDSGVVEEWVNHDRYIKVRMSNGTLLTIKDKGGPYKESGGQIRTFLQLRQGQADGGRGHSGGATNATTEPPAKKAKTEGGFKGIKGKSSGILKIDGEEYERTLIEIADSVMSDGHIERFEAEALWFSASDGNKIKPLQEKTLRYIMSSSKYKLDDEADNYLEHKVYALDARGGRSGSVVAVVAVVAMVVLAVVVVAVVVWRRSGSVASFWP